MRRGNEKPGVRRKAGYEGRMDAEHLCPFIMKCHFSYLSPLSPFHKFQGHFHISKRPHWITLLSKHAKKVCLSFSRPLISTLHFVKPYFYVATPDFIHHNKCGIGPFALHMMTFPQVLYQTTQLHWHLTFNLNFWGLRKIEVLNSAVVAQLISIHPGHASIQCQPCFDPVPMLRSSADVNLHLSAAIK